MNNVKWTISELKLKAKELLKKYYWYCVLVGFVALVLENGCNSGGNVFLNLGGLDDVIAQKTEKILMENLYNDLYKDMGYIGHNYVKSDGGYYIQTKNIYAIESVDYDAKEDNLNECTLGIVILGVGVATMLLNLFWLNPLRIGFVKFWVGITKDDCQISYLGYGFKNNYLNNVKTMFLVYLKIFLWSLLFVIPGVIKAYEYFMVPYILTEHPGISSKEAFALSKKLMDGHKGKVFLLQLSFLGWMLLSLLTCGILNIFYVVPYMAITLALVYEQLDNKPICNPNTISSVQAVTQDLTSAEILESILKKLSMLKERGLITEEEYQKKRSELF